MKFEIPDEPTVDRLWTQDEESGTSIEWKRADCGGWVPSVTPEGALYGWMSWTDLLGIGPVFNVHPSVAQWPTPWSANGTCIHDAQGAMIITTRGSALASLVVDAINRYVAWAD